MIDLLQFFDHHTFLAFLAVCFTYGIIIRILRWPNIWLRGWPTSCDTHVLDADGDWHKKDDTQSKVQGEK